MSFPNLVRWGVMALPAFVTLKAWLHHLILIRVHRTVCWICQDQLLIVVKTEDICFSQVHEPKMWDNLKGQFMGHIDEVIADLKTAGRPPLGSEMKQQ